MKRVNHYNTSRDKLLHVETDGGIINIRVGLTDRIGRSVISVEIIPTQSEGWKLRGYINNHLIKLKGGN